MVMLSRASGGFRTHPFGKSSSGLYPILSCYPSQFYEEIWGEGIEQSSTQEVHHQTPESIFNGKAVARGCQLEQRNSHAKEQHNFSYNIFWLKIAHPKLFFSLWGGRYENPFTLRENLNRQEQKGKGPAALPSLIIT